MAVGPRPTRCKTYSSIPTCNGKPQAKAIVALVALAGLMKGELRGLMSTDDPGENIANSSERVA